MIREPVGGFRHYTQAPAQLDTVILERWEKVNGLRAQARERRAWMAEPNLSAYWAGVGSGAASISR